MKYHVVISKTNDDVITEQYYRESGSSLVELASKIIMIFAQIERKNSEELVKQLAEVINDDIPF